VDKVKKHLHKEGVPHEYQVYCKVFLEEEAKQLPPNCSKDMAITLKEGSLEQLDCKVYPLSSKELGVLQQALNEDLAKGYIKHRTSSFISLIFFIPKKDREEL